MSSREIKRHDVNRGGTWTLDAAVGSPVLLQWHAAMTGEAQAKTLNRPMCRTLCQALPSSPTTMADFAHHPTFVAEVVVLCETAWCHVVSYMLIDVFCERAIVRHAIYGC